MTVDILDAILAYLPQTDPTDLLSGAFDEIVRLRNELDAMTETIDTVRNGPTGQVATMRILDRISDRLAGITTELTALRTVAEAAERVRAVELDPFACDPFAHRELDAAITEWRNR